MSWINTLGIIDSNQHDLPAGRCHVIESFPLEMTMPSLPNFPINGFEASPTNISRHRLDHVKHPREEKLSNERILRWFKSVNGFIPSLCISSNLKCAFLSYKAKYDSRIGESPWRSWRSLISMITRGLCWFIACWWPFYHAITSIIAQVYRLSAVHCQMTRYSQRVPGYLTRYSVSANETSFDNKISQSDCVFQVRLGLEENDSPLHLVTSTGFLKA